MPRPTTKPTTKRTRPGKTRGKPSNGPRARPAVVTGWNPAPTANSPRQRTSGPWQRVMVTDNDIALTTEHIESEEGIVTTPAPDEWLAPMVARVAEAPALPFGDQLFQRLLRHPIGVLRPQDGADLANSALA